MSASKVRIEKAGIGRRLLGRHARVADAMERIEPFVILALAIVGAISIVAVRTGPAVPHQKRGDGVSAETAVAALRRRLAESQWIVCAEAVRIIDEHVAPVPAGPAAPACTARSAMWCPVCGECSCPEPESAKDDLDCGLHSINSDHGSAE